MNQYSRGHLSDGALLHVLATRVSQDRSTTAEMLADLAEAEVRKLYRPAGYPSMVEYCIGEFRLPRQSALKRLRAARIARRFPIVFGAIADGRLNVSSVILLSPYLIEQNADELLSAAMGKTNEEVELFVAERFPKSDLIEWVEVPLSQVSARTPDRPVISGSAEAGVAAWTPNEAVTLNQPEAEVSVRTPDGPVISRSPELHASARTPQTPASRTPALSPGRFGLQLTMSQAMHEKLRRAQELLSHQVPPGDMAQVVEKALDALIEKLEKRKFAASAKPRAPRQIKSKNPRHVPAHVKRAVRERDGDRCTFVSESGHRCDSRKRLEFDHATEVARGGDATVDNIRLRCRTHNQYTAERTFGAEFMQHKRLAAREARTAEQAPTVSVAARQP